MLTVLKEILPGFLGLIFSAQMAFAGTLIPRDNSVLDQIASPSRDILNAAKIDVLVWNVHKGEDKNAWAMDLNQLAADKELILLQEAMKDDFMPGVLRSISSFGWNFATSWINTPNMAETGVVSGSPARPMDISFRRSPGREPVLQTPKMTLISDYTLDNGDTLKVVNLHGINFVSLIVFENQIKDVAESLLSYQGRLIFAGDFNTWNIGRIRILLKAAGLLGLSQVQFPDDHRKTKFDHIFVRGCTYSNAQVLETVKTSDHSPLSVTLNCSPFFSPNHL